MWLTCCQDRSDNLNFAGSHRKFERALPLLNLLSSSGLKHMLWPFTSAGQSNPSWIGKTWTLGRVAPKLGI